MENRTELDGERVVQVEGSLQQAQLLAEDADRKYDEVVGLHVPETFINLLRALLCFWTFLKLFLTLNYLTRCFFMHTWAFKG